MESVTSIIPKFSTIFTPIIFIMKQISLFISITLLFAATFFVLPQQEKSVKKRLTSRPEEDYFITPQIGHLGEGLDLYKQAIQVELKKMKKKRSIGGSWQIEGPLEIGGRINCIAMHPSIANHYLVGCADGGIFKTTDGGLNWTPIFDNAYALSISCIEYEPNNANTIFVGTGDAALGGYSHMGNGIYKSTNGGSTWTQIGLDNVGVINELIIDKNNTQVLYAATSGNVFTSGMNRGLYKSTDGGATWANILYLGANVGVSEVVMHPTNSSILYACGQRRYRSDQQSIITGNEVKIYRSVDAGATWDTLSNGLPFGTQCKVGLAISNTNPNKMYALYIDSVNLDYGGLYKSLDGGNSWNLVNSSSISMGGFGWYFGEIRLDPNNDNTVYVLSVRLYKSTDGGITFSEEYLTHADKHDLKFVNENSNSILLATDGGFYKSLDAGNTWTVFNNLPITQFYEVACSPFDSLSYYGGAQDNGTNSGSVLSGANNWNNWYGADGFRPQFDTIDPNIMYAEWQNGNIVATDNGGAFWNNISQDLLLQSNNRTSWNTPYLLSKYASNTLYAGTYQVYKSVDGPYTNSWTMVSPDLTNGGSNTSFFVITSIDESKLSSNILYAGTSNAKCWHSLNGGVSWVQISAGLANRNISCVSASPNNVNHVFVTQSGYRNNDSLPHIYFSNDKGLNWNSIAGDMPNLAINDVWVLPSHNDSCVVVATDGGVYATSNKGVNWQRVGNNMPLIPVYDLEYNKSTKRLVAGTFARSMQTIAIDSVFPSNPIDPLEPSSISQARKPFQILMYPNPAADLVTFDVGDAQCKRAILFDAFGRRVKSYQFKTNQARLDVSNLARGLYWVSIQTTQGEATKRLVLQ
jgi:photosystem II stability/assembly factor-like uncharacterized protein